ncbi:MAG TPA: ectonucleotide pyrophosphatase/phosphodiesterase [Longimicrobiales bacterium]|nr:ectonucleotide pyrophosphatase/phosphodiesterase [Longimicrobiales bacterium]
MHRTYLAFLLVFTVFTTARSQSGPTDDVVVLVSFDGFRHDYLDRGVTPNFTRLAKAGVRADALIPIFPSKTFPNHYSIVTGMYGEHHGIVGNEFFDPVWGDFKSADHSDPNVGRWFGGEPIWVTAERQGVRSASYFWVGSDTKINGALPSLWKKYDEHVLFNARVDTALAWLSLPERERPRLVLLYFELMDNAGHDFGPDSPQVDSALAKADSILGRLMDGIERANRTTLIVVSDHGMSEVSPERRVPIDSLADLTGVRVVATGPYSTLYFQSDTIRRNDVAAKLKALPHSRVYKRDEIPARYHWHDNARIPDVLIVADEGWMVGPRRMMERVRHGGQHGYDPEVKVMQGIFVAAGPRIRAGQRIPAFENVHIHPFIAQLLGIAPAPHIDGDAAVLAPLLKW